MTENDSPENSPRTMRIDELARRAGVPSRTIRYYTQQDLLPPPRLKGRVGYYGPGHLERLLLIRELQEQRYLPLSVIRTVLRRRDAGIDLELMLAPLDRVFAPRPDSEGRAEMTRAELAEQAGVGEDVVDAAESMGFLFPTRRDEHEMRYSQDDLQMLRVAADFIALDLPWELAELYRSSLEKIAAVQVRAFGQSVVAPLAREGRPPAEMRQALLDGYAHMSRTCSRLVAMLHRKLLQQAVERGMSGHAVPRGRDDADE